jgi:hypothetical protein
LYPRLIPIDTSASEWAKSITYYSQDRVGLADWFDGAATSMPMADINRDKREQGIEMAGIGYRYNLEELGVAALVPGTNLSSEKAEAARRAYEEFIDRLVRVGDKRKKIAGLFNNPFVTQITAPAVGTGSSSLWSTKNADQIIADVNNSLTQVYTGSNSVEMADTVLLPIANLQLLAEHPRYQYLWQRMEYLQKYNLWTATTQQPLTILGVLSLDTAGVGGTARMITYRRDPQIPSSICQCRIGSCLSSNRADGLRRSGHLSCRFGRGPPPRCDGVHGRNLKEANMTDKASQPVAQTAPPHSDSPPPRSQRRSSHSSAAQPEPAGAWSMAAR